MIYRSLPASRSFSASPLTREAPAWYQIAILGQNTNFIRNKTRVEIFNDTGVRIAYAEPVPGTDNVVVLSDTSLTAILTINDPSQVTSGSLFGTWDVVVSTPFDVRG